MRLLLDTQILLWGLEDLDKLASAELAAIASPDNTIYFSPVNVWEIAIKRGLGKLDVGPDFLTRVRAEPSLKALPIKLEHAWRVQELPSLHRDPFDRLLISQARVERMPIITRDFAIRQYEVMVFGRL